MEKTASTNHFLLQKENNIELICINRRISVGIIQLFLKQFQRSMTFYFYINPAVSTLTTIDQIQGYYPSLTTIYQNSDCFFNNQGYSLPWTQTEVNTQNQTINTLTNSILMDQVPNMATLKSLSSLKQKRRAEKSLEKEILSAKKNSQSNIINQFYSFFSSRQKSEKIVERCCLILGKTQEKIQRILSLFYATIRLINVKRGRKYVNVAMFLKFFTAQELGNYLSEIKQKLEGCQTLSVQELCEIFRRCAKHFLKNISVNAILTSKRISVVSKEQHLKKRRKILRTILEN